MVTKRKRRRRKEHGGKVEVEAKIEGEL